MHKQKKSQLINAHTNKNSPHIINSVGQQCRLVKSVSLFNKNDGTLLKNSGPECRDLNFNMTNNPNESMSCPRTKLNAYMGGTSASYKAVRVYSIAVCLLIIAQLSYKNGQFLLELSPHERLDTKLSYLASLFFLIKRLVNNDK